MEVNHRPKGANRAPRPPPLGFNQPADAPAAKQEKQLLCEKRGTKKESIWRGEQSGTGESGG